MDINKFRRGYLAFSEMVDAFRVLPRALVALYCYLIYKVVNWYMELSPYMIEGCNSAVVKDCIVQAPTTQHAALVTAVVGIAAAIFGLYASTGRKWEGFTPWKTEEKKEESSSEKA